jgi:hypothetical protein
LSTSGARHFPAKIIDGRQQSAVSFFMELAKADIPQIAVENPVCIMSSMWRKPDQVIQPWQYGHGEKKATCLWLKNLPTLIPTKIVEGRSEGLYNLWPGPERSKLRSVTYTGIAEAMADQWTDTDLLL